MMVIASTHRFIIILLAFVSRCADARLVCRSNLLVDDQSCKATNINNVFNRREKLTSCLVSYFLCGSTRPTLLQGAAHTLARRPGLCCAYNILNDNLLLQPLWTTINMSTMQIFALPPRVTPSRVHSHTSIRPYTQVTSRVMGFVHGCPVFKTAVLVMRPRST